MERKTKARERERGRKGGGRRLERRESKNVEKKGDD